ncbi:MAG: GIY-YIG nuclease family protein [Ectothiorhodospiraceae bacterium]|nr:GIY-YIG nuclease family protein [Ectothiorhodospiraceae bacterium]
MGEISQVDPQLFAEEYLRVLDCRGMGLTERQPTVRWYVYFLVDPRDGAIFYVGKGSGRRMYVHRERLGSDKNHLKAARIEQIIADGHEPLCRVFDVFDEEGEAFSCERVLIAALREHGLTNLAGGILTGKDRIMAHARRLLETLTIHPEHPVHDLVRAELEKQAVDPAPNVIRIASSGHLSWGWA